MNCDGSSLYSMTLSTSTNAAATPNNGISLSLLGGPPVAQGSLVDQWRVEQGIASSRGRPQPVGGRHPTLGVDHFSRHQPPETVTGSTAPTLTFTNNSGILGSLSQGCCPPGPSWPMPYSRSSAPLASAWPEHRSQASAPAAAPCRWRNERTPEPRRRRRPRPGDRDVAGALHPSGADRVLVARASAGESASTSATPHPIVTEPAETRVTARHWALLAVVSGLLPAYVLHRVGWSINAVPPLLLLVGLVQLAYCDLRQRLLPKALVYAISAAVIVSTVVVAGADGRMAPALRRLRGRSRVLCPVLRDEPHQPALAGLRGRAALVHRRLRVGLGQLGGARRGSVLRQPARRSDRVVPHRIAQGRASIGGAFRPVPRPRHRPGPRHLDPNSSRAPLPCPPHTRFQRPSSAQQLRGGRWVASDAERAWTDPGRSR